MNVCVIIPTYNNAPKLKGVIQGVLKHSLPVIVVNDGSTDGTEDILAEFAAALEIIEYEQNRGKGFALLKGFERANSLGIEAAITIDSDGQHDPCDIKDLLEVHKNHPNKILMGSRDLEAAGAPGKSSFGNKFSNFWFWVETGIRLPDTQTGFRLYPVKPVCRFKYITNRFGFEIESIVKLAWSGVEFIPVHIGVSYPEDRITHFRPIKDFARISALNTWLVTLAVLYHIPKRLFKRKSARTSIE